jgi:lipopolysaccharide/colanic/teichoic acid biosynthesis glycosyltransferase
MPDNFYANIGKRFFDTLLSIFGIILFSPLLLMISLAIKIADKGPIFYSQIRIGQNFRKFRLFKFRSMITDADNNGFFITHKGDPRITPVGKFLRKYKLDEFPQLINVLMGDMSFVGPRPEVEKYVEKFREDYKYILSVKPGLTDFASLEYIDEEEILKKFSNIDESYVDEILPKKIELYKKYISEISFKTDQKIIFKTLFKLSKL